MEEFDILDYNETGFIFDIIELNTEYCRWYSSPLFCDTLNNYVPDNVEPEQEIFLN